jgi:peptidyl-tRNA hydrolase
VGPVPANIGGGLSEFVLEPPDASDRAAITALLDPMAEAVECWITDGIQAAMNQYNRRTSEP